MDAEKVKGTFRADGVVEHYSRSVVNIGLWRSEERIFRRVFREEDSLLDLGCGAGRICIGLWELGYRNLLGVDYSAEMIREARRLCGLMEYGIALRTGDAVGLELDDGAFDGVIFGFNGLMQIPGRERRRRALTEINRVLRPGGAFVFTTHDREHRSLRELFAMQQQIWARGEQPADLNEFGDNFFRAPEGDVFMHLPDRSEVLEDLAATGFEHEFDAMRSEIANEPGDVREFSDECRFWLATKPA